MNQVRSTYCMHDKYRKFYDGYMLFGNKATYCENCYRIRDPKKITCSTCNFRRLSDLGMKDKEKDKELASVDVVTQATKTEETTVYFGSLLHASEKNDIEPKKRTIEHYIGERYDIHNYLVDFMNNNKEFIAEVQKDGRHYGFVYSNTSEVNVGRYIQVWERLEEILDKYDQKDK